MKRYKVSKDIVVLSQLVIDRFGVIEKHHIVGGIPAGTEIWLEEIKDTEVKVVGHYCPNSKDCKTCKKEKEKVKEEKEMVGTHATMCMCDNCDPIKRVERKAERQIREAEMIKQEAYEDQPKEEEECEDCICIEKRPQCLCNCHGEFEGLKFGEKYFVKNQPLTPKDVVVTRKLAIKIDNFIEWAIEEHYKNIHNISDEEFDRLYQEFLKEQLNNK